MGLGELINRTDSGTFVPEVALIPANPTASPCGHAVYIRVYCSAASTLPGSGVQVSFTWNDPAGNPQEHDTIISLDAMGFSSIPEIFVISLGVGEGVNIQATEVGDGEFTAEYAYQTLFYFP